LCWQTIEKLFIPAIVKVSAGSHYNMKTLIIILLIFIEASVFGQDLGNFKIVDTLKIIKSLRLPDQRISYLNEDYEFQFSKKVCIKVIDTLLKSLESELENNDTMSYTKEDRLKDIHSFTTVRSYIKDQESLKLKKPFFDKKVDNSLELADSLFSFIAPAMLDAGRFKLFLSGKQQSTLIKVEVTSGNDYYSQVEIGYLTQSGKEVWTCLPYIDSFSEPVIDLKEAKPIELPEPEK
jgi:hypothetical protein